MVDLDPAGAPIADHARARRLDPDERRAQIVEAAFVEFGDKGFDAARLDDVARRAGIAKGTIYLHFADKEALFGEMLRRATADRLDELEAESLADPRADFDRIVARVWAYLLSDRFPVVHRLATAVLPRFPDLAQHFAAHASGRLRRILAVAIARVAATGAWHVDDPLVAARMLHALLLQHAAMRPIPGAWQAAGIRDGDDALAAVLRFFEAALRPAAVTDRPSHA